MTEENQTGNNQTLNNQTDNNSPAVKTSTENKDNNEMPKWVKDFLPPILSALGSMGGSYMIWIKPLQEKLESLEKKVKEVLDQIEELQEENNQLKKLMGSNSQKQNDFGATNYLPVKTFAPQRSTYRGNF
ncbi:MAG: hypothetical protein NT150_13870 [Bacteroidetes bacterium]|nr:hypothetical protein [Bacteroidota bacterium]